MLVESSADARALRRLADDLEVSVSALQRGIHRALRITAKKVMAQAKKHVRQRYRYADMKRIKDRIVEGDSALMIEFTGPVGAGLVHFAPRPSFQPDWRGIPPKRRNPRAGVSSIIIKGGKRKVYAGPNGEKPFWARTKQGFMALFYRGKPPKNSLVMLFGPSPMQALGRSAEAPLRLAAEEGLETNLEREMRAVMLGYIK